MTDLSPGDALDLSLREIKVRGEETVDLLRYACVALYEAGTKAARGEDGDSIVEYVEASLAVIHGKVGALAGPEQEDRDAT